MNKPRVPAMLLGATVRREGQELTLPVHVHERGA
jgi:hypothetical protein